MLGIIINANVALLLHAGPALAADVAKVGSCLLGNCQVVLAKCMADGECLENLICLQLCNGRPDETACQVISSLWQRSVRPCRSACSLPVAVRSVLGVWRV